MPGMQEKTLHNLFYPDANRSDPFVFSVGRFRFRLSTGANERDGGIAKKHYSRTTIVGSLVDGYPLYFIS